MLMVDLIDRLPVFEGLTQAEKRRVAEMDTTFIRFGRDEAILREDSHGSAFYILIKGSVRVTKNDLPNRVIALLKPGTIFGEIAFLTGSPRSSNVFANEDEVVAMQISRETMDELPAATREKIKDKLIELLAGRINRMNDALVRLLAYGHGREG